MKKIYWLVLYFGGTIYPLEVEVRLEEILSAMEKAGNELRTFTAAFEQTDYDYILEDQEISSGKLFVEKPHQVRWEYETPHVKILTAKDKLVRIYNPSAAQVQEFEQTAGQGRSAGMDLLVGFGSGNGQLRENYDTSLVKETSDYVVLKLLPKSDSSTSMFASIELTLDKQTWIPTRSVFYEINKDRTDIRFIDSVLNRSLPKGIFELVVPSNVEIVRNKR